VRMRFIISIAITTFAFLGLPACNSMERHLSSAAPANPAISPSTPPQADGARRVTTTELKGLMDKGQVFVVDVRSDAAYKAGHIKGAVLIPFKDVGTRIKEFPRDKMIVTYCA
jgi:3-mercaptopyruvate sulfurtransferase SseA